MLRRPFSAFAYAAGMLCSLASCQRDAKIMIVGTGTTPEFVVEATGGKTCIDRLVIYPVENENTGAPTSWGIGRAFGRGDADCRDRFFYGQITPGYETDSVAKPLVAGNRYRVRAFGGGWSASSDWSPR